MTADREKGRAAEAKYRAKRSADPAAHAARNAYARTRARQTYVRRKAEAIDYLGGRCVDCSATLSLEFDHREPAKKSFGITTQLVGMTWEKLKVELDKCDLRCTSCHAHQTAIQRMGSIDLLQMLSIQRA